MKKKSKIVLIILIIVILLAGGFLITKKILKHEDKNETIKVLDNIADFGYTLDDRDTDIMKNEFNELKKILKEKDIDYGKYAEEIAKLFVIDLFTLNNKINKYDVGSFEYVYPDNVNNFKVNVEDTIYKHMENNSKGKRSQILPIVKNVLVEKVEDTKFKIGDKEMDGYKVKLNWDYERDLGYDKKATITLVKTDNKLYVVEYVSGE